MSTYIEFHYQNNFQLESGVVLNNLIIAYHTYGTIRVVCDDEIIENNTTFQLEVILVMKFDVCAHGFGIKSMGITPPTFVITSLFQIGLFWSYRLNRMLVPNQI